MNKTAIIALIIAGVSLFLAAMENHSDFSPAQQKTIQNEILKVQEKMKTAAESLDVDELYKHVLDVNDVIIENGELRNTRKEALGITKQGFQGIRELTYTYKHKNIAVLSPGNALWTGTGTTTVILEDGREITRDFAETLVFILRNGQWKVLHAHRSSPQ